MSCAKNRTTWPYLVSQSINAVKGIRAPSIQDRLGNGMAWRGADLRSQRSLRQKLSIQGSSLPDSSRAAVAASRGRRQSRLPDVKRPSGVAARGPVCAGGDERIRTADLCRAKAALSQLSHVPMSLRRAVQSPCRPRAENSLATDRSFVNESGRPRIRVDLGDRPSR